MSKQNVGFGEEKAQIKLSSDPLSWNKELVKIKDVTIFEGGSYKKVTENIDYIGSVKEYYNIVSVQFNQLKAKIFNLIEATITNEKQQKALNGLIKEFCNTGYKNTIEDLKGLMVRLNLEEDYELLDCGIVREEEPDYIK